MYFVCITCSMTEKMPNDSKNAFSSVLVVGTVYTSVRIINVKKL